MKKSLDYKINPNSLYFSTIVNLMYLLPLFSILFAMNIFSIDIKVQLIISLIYFIIIEYLHRFHFSKMQAINFIYKVKNNLFIKVGENKYSIFDNLFKIFNISFWLFSFWFVLTFNNSSTHLEHKILEAVPTIITISAIILTLVLAVVEYFSKKFPDFLDLMNNWKRDIFGTFLILLIYAIVSFFTSYFYNVLNVDFWLFITSIALALQLFIVGCEATILINDIGILSIKKNYLLNFIRKSPNIQSTDELIRKFDNSFKNKTIKAKFKNFVNNYILGFLKDSIYELPEPFNKLLKNEFEALFRVANNYIRENNLNLFKITMESINEVSLELIDKTKGVEHFNNFEYIASKLKELFDTATKLKLEYFFDDIVDINTNIIKKLISVSKTEYGRFSNAATISFLIEQLQYFIIKSSVFKHTTITTNTIAELRDIAGYLISKGDEHIVISIINCLNFLTKVFDKISDENKSIEKFWATTLTYKILYAQINIMFYLIMSSFEPNRQSYRYQQDELIESYIETFKICASQNLPSHPIDSLIGLMPNTTYTLLYNCVARKTHIKTPYYNLRVKGAIEHITQVASMSEIFGHVFISDLRDSIPFKPAIKNLMRLLDILLEIPKESINGLYVNAFIRFVNDIKNSCFLFIQRIKDTNFQIDENIKFANLFLNKVLDVSFYLFKDYYQSHHNNSFIYEYMSYLAEFLLKNKFFNDGDIDIESKLEQQILEIEELFNEETDEGNKRILLSNLKFLNVVIFEDLSRTKLFKDLFKFILSNQDIIRPQSHYICGWQEQEGLPFEAGREINDDDMINYIKFRERYKRRFLTEQ